MAILVTGGTGYIGSHTVVELLKDGREPIIVDNFSNSCPEVLHRIEAITGKAPKFYEVDLLDKAALEKVFAENEIDAVIHFAGLKAVGESVSVPLRYYHNNVTGTLVLLQVMQKYACKRLVFSSSATVYGDPASVPIREDFPLSATNPYGMTKLMIENILRDLYVSDQQWSICLLRYFNPIGAHESGLMGEDPNGIPNNLMPYITKVAAGTFDHLSVYGDDYDTPDGTGVRDYIHVVDLSRGHLSALDYVKGRTGVDAINLGTGVGYSVLDVVHAYEKAAGCTIPYTVVPRRPGDVPKLYADTTKAEKVLGWRAEYTLDDMCRDSANWQAKNPGGYHGA